MSSFTSKFSVFIACKLTLFLYLVDSASTENFTGFQSCNSASSSQNNTFVLKLPTESPQSSDSLLCQIENHEHNFEKTTTHVQYRSGYFSDRLNPPLDGSDSDICPEFQLVPANSQLNHTHNCAVTSTNIQFSIYAPFPTAREDVAPWAKLDRKQESLYTDYTIEYLITRPENCTLVLVQYRIDLSPSRCHEKVAQYCYTRQGPDTCDEEFYPQSIWYKQRNSGITWNTVLVSASGTNTVDDLDSLEPEVYTRRSNIGARKFVGTFLILSVLIFYVKYGMLRRGLQMEEHAASEAAEQAEFDSLMNARRLVALNRFMDMGTDRRSLESPYSLTSLLDSPDSSSGCGTSAPPPRYPGHSVYINVEDEDSPPTYEEAVALQK